MNSSGTTSILLVTPSVGFGNLIRQTLEESGKYKVNQYTNVVGILTGETQNTEPLAILDGDLGNLILLNIGARLRGDNPAIRVILVPRGKESAEVIDILNPLGTLNKPFYLPDLMETVEKVLALKSIPSPPKFGTTPTKITPLPTPKRSTPAESSAQEEIEHPEPKFVPSPASRSSLEWLRNAELASHHLKRLSMSTAARAALITKEQTIWAYSGKLPQQVADQLAGAIHHYWSSYGDSDLARFIRIDDSGEEFLLYATSIDETFVLSLAFDANAPFSIIRSQASKMAREIAEVRVSEPAVQTENHEKHKSERRTPPAKPTSAPKPMPQQPPNVEVDLAEDIRTAPLPRAPLPYQTAKPAPKPEEPYAPDRSHLAETQPTRTKGSDTPESFSPMVAPPPLEPATAAQYNLTYACVLIPRFPKHHLTRELSSQIDKWIPQICIAFGWRVEHLIIRPGYLQWIVNVEPDTSPDYLMRIIRKITSQRIFTEFPAIETENPSGDFWAPGYLIMSGAEMPPPQRLKEFISDTRRRQGLAD